MIEPPGEAKPDWWITCEIAKRMGYGDKFNFSSPEEVFEEIRKVVPQYRGITYARLKKPGGMLRTGIPRYRLPEEDLERDIAIVKRAGVKIKTGHKVKSLKALKRQGFDAVFLAFGAYGSWNLGVPGERSKGVIDCVSFLLDVTMNKKKPEGRKFPGGFTHIAKGKVAAKSK